MLALAFLVSTYLLKQQAKRENFNPDTVFNLVFLSFLAGVAGARIFFVVENWRYYLSQPLEIIMLWQGGLSWFGGLIFGSLAAGLYLRKKKLPAAKSLDLIAPFLALAQSIGRIGCFLNGCCFGTIFGFLPVQIFSSFALLAIYIFLRLAQARPHKPGRIIFLYLLLYSIKRFFVEFWRLDNPAVFRNLTLFHILSIALFLFAVLGLLSCSRKNKS